MKALLFSLIVISLAMQQATASPSTARILDDKTIPHYNSVIITNLRNDASKAGYRCELDNTASLANVTPLNCSLLIVPNASYLPVTLIKPLTSYLASGGNVLITGGPLGRYPLLKSSGGAWITSLQLQEQNALTPPPHPLSLFSSNPSLTGWQRASNTMYSKTDFSVKPIEAHGRSAYALTTSISNLNGWDTLSSPPLNSPFPNGQTLTVLSAKGDATTTSLSIEWDEKDGSRWIAVVKLTPQWRQIVIQPSSFHLWTGPASDTSRGFDPQNATRLVVGEAFGFTSPRPGSYHYEISELGTASVSQLPVQAASIANPPDLDLIAPAYKFFRIHGTVNLKLKNGATISSVSQPDLLSPQPRPSGSGFDKQRFWRFIPLITAYDDHDAEWRGTPAVLMLHVPGATNNGDRAFFTFTDSSFYRNPAVNALITSTIVRMKAGIFLLDGGSSRYTLFEGQNADIGADMLNLSDSPRTAKVLIKIAAKQGSTVWSHSWPCVIQPHSIASVSTSWLPPKVWPSHGYVIVTSIRVDGKVIDAVNCPLHVWIPPLHPHYVSIASTGHFILNKHIIRFNGINYMPSSGIGQNHDDLYERWMSAAAYDPKIVQRDLNHIKQLGINAISIFIYEDDVKAQNLLDILRRCQKIGLRAQVSMRPSLNTYLWEDYKIADNQAWAGFKNIVTYYHLKQNPTVFSYEIAWEPRFGGEAARTPMDPEWRRWVLRKYGSINSAVKSWGVPEPENSSGELTGPTDADLDQSGGPVTRLCADYRAFLNHWLARAYGTITQRLHALDPNHPVSFRMTSAGYPGDAGAANLPYQLEGNARAVDYLAPECYGRIGIPYLEHTIPFEIAYGHAVAPHEPFVWAEAGMSVWDQGQKRDSSSALQTQAAYFRTLYNYSIKGGVDGIFWWWYPGGYRVNEKSDYGVINPDGTLRPVSTVIMKYGKLLMHPPKLAPSTKVFTFNVYAYPNGIVSVYKQLSNSFWKAWEAGDNPTLKPAKTEYTTH